MKRRFPPQASLALLAMTMLLTMPWLASAYGPLDHRSVAIAEAADDQVGDLPADAGSFPVQERSAQSPATWQTKSVDGGGVGSYTSIALDAEDHPHISYHDHDSKNLKYARWTGQSWATQTVATGEDVGLFTSLALDAESHPHISYYDRARHYLWYATWTGANWSRETLDINNKAGLYPSLALDADDHPNIAYFARNDILHIEWTGSKWVVRRIDGTVQGLGLGISLDLDGYDHAHVVYCDSDGRELRYAHWTGSRWEILVVEDDRQIRWPSLKLDARGHAHISYCDYDYTKSALKYARWTGSGWDIQTLERVGGEGCHTSLALDGDDYPRISYHDSKEDSLKYAYWNGSTWYIETVDSGGGTDSSLALDHYGRPHISYYDRVNRALKHAIQFASSDLSSSLKTAYPTRVRAGETVTYTIQLVDRGDLYQSTPFALADPIPPNTTYVPNSARASGGEISYASGITWNGTVSGAQSLTATFALVVDPTLDRPTAIVNTAVLTGSFAGPLDLSATIVVNPLEAFLPLAAKGE
jgi:uncharacterized repeat protein (TIGR01451 family)